MGKDNLKVRILCGIPGSGKSTWAKDFLLKNSNWVRVNRDDFRLMLRNEQMCQPKIEDLVSILQAHAINAALNKNLNVIVDNTNLKAKYIDAIIELVITKADVEFQIFDISKEKAIERDVLREKTVGKAVIENMYKDYLNIIDTYNFVNLSKKHRVHWEVVQDKTLPKAVIFDIDGTLAHMNGKRGPFDWNKVHRDDVDNIVAEQARTHYKNGDRVIIMSGRDGSCRKLTEEWLELHEIPYNHIFMRTENDMRKDNIIKQELYAQYIEGKFYVAVVYDDRQQVVDMWRSLGLKVFQVNPGDF